MSPVARRLGSYLRPHGPALALSALLVALHAAVPGALVWIVRTVLDDVLIRQDRAMLVLVPFAVVGLYALNGALTIGRGMLTRSVSWAVVTALRRELFAQYLRLDAGWHASDATGRRVSRLTGDVSDIQLGMSGIVTAAQKPLTLVLLVGMAFWMNARLTAIAICLLPLVAWPIHRFGRRLRQAARHSLDGVATLSASSTETLTGIRAVHAFGAEAWRMERFDRDNEQVRSLQMRSQLAQLVPGPSVELIAAVGVGAVIWAGGQQVFSGDVAPGALIAFLVALGLLNEPLKGIAQIHALVQRSLASAEAAFEVIDRNPAVADSGTVELSTDRVSLAFEDVAFSYGDRSVLDGVAFSVEPGRVVALVGASGAGKTTIANLVPRFWDPTRGSVRLNGRDVREYTLASLRRHVAMVTQEAILFDDTVRANVAFGLDVSDEAIREAACVANADGFIRELSRGYDTPVGESGVRLSAGQRQRICIARAVLRNAPLLVLDEATSALDAESEALVQEALDRLMEHRTVLAIAHRLSTVRGADEILVLDRGRIAERGRHDELMALGGAYARLVRRQE